MESSILKNLYDKLSTYELERNNIEVKKRQSSVAIIFRINPKYFIKPEQLFQTAYQFLDYTSQIQKKINRTQDKDGFFQILFLQRSINQKDTNSGLVCYPGGKCDNNQNDLQAAIRQTFEQTNILLNKSNIIGKIKRNFYVRQVKNQRLFTTGFVFLLQQSNVLVKLNQQQMMDFNWFPFKNILYNNDYIRQLKVPSLGYFLTISKDQICKVAQLRQIKNNFQYIGWPAIEVGLNMLMFGLSYYILVQFCYTIVTTSRNILKAENSEQSLINLIKHGFYLNISFKKQFKQGEKIKQIIRRLYFKERQVGSITKCKL